MVIGRRSFGFLILLIVVIGNKDIPRVYLSFFPFLSLTLSKSSAAVQHTFVHCFRTILANFSTLLSLSCVLYHIVCVSQEPTEILVADWLIISHVT